MEPAWWDAAGWAGDKLAIKVNFVRAFSRLNNFSLPGLKIYLPFFRKVCLSLRIPRSQEGRFGQSSRTLGAGCDGRKGARKTSAAGADGEIVWS